MPCYLITLKAFLVNPCRRTVAPDVVSCVNITATTLIILFFDTSLYC